MFCLTNDRNNIRFKKVLPDRKTRTEIDICNTIDYDVKSYQVNKYILNCTYLRLKELKNLTTHRRYVGIYNMNVMQIIKFYMIRNHLNGAAAKFKSNMELKECEIIASSNIPKTIKTRA